MGAPVLFLATLAALALVHFSAPRAALRMAQGDSCAAAVYSLLALLGTLVVVGIVASSLNWGAL